MKGCKMRRVTMQWLRIQKWLVVLFSAALIPTAVLAETYPNKPIRIIVPFAAGGAVDVVAQGLEIQTSTPGEFTALTKARLEQMARIIKDAQVAVE